MEGQFSTETETKTLEIESFLTNNAYLSGGPLPGAQDSQIFLSLKAAPDQSKYPNFFYWYSALSMFNPAVIKTWGAKAQKAEKPHKEEAKKEEAKPAADDDDLFGEETEEDKARLEAKKADDLAKKNKPKAVVIAKSIIIFDVKIMDEEQDLDTLAKKNFEN